MAGNTAPANTFSIHYTMVYTISLTSITITQVIHLLVDFVENQIVFWNYEIQNSIRIINDSWIIEVLLYLASHGWVGRHPMEARQLDRKPQEGSQGTNY